MVLFFERWKDSRVVETGVYFLLLLKWVLHQQTMESFIKSGLPKQCYYNFSLWIKLAWTVWHTMDDFLDVAGPSCDSWHDVRMSVWSLRSCLYVKNGLGVGQALSDTVANLSWSGRKRIACPLFSSGNSHQTRGQLWILCVLSGNITSSHVLRSIVRPG